MCTILLFLLLPSHICLLQALLEESARLKEAYPGGNAEHIAAQQTSLAEAWQDLQDATVCRRDALKAAYDLQRFYVNVRI